MAHKGELERIADALEHIADSLTTHDKWLSMAGEGAMSIAEWQAHVVSALCRIESELRS
jgi:hypothetical protein